MKKTSLALVIISSLLLSSNAISMEQKPGQSEIQQQYEKQLNQGKSYKDAFEALQYEIAYEQAAVHSKSPCRKLVRGL